MGEAIVAVILPLVGVVLGTVGALTGQLLATRGESRRHADQQAAAVRAERKETIAGFLDATQRVEQVIDRRIRDGLPPSASSDDLLSALWLAKKMLELICSNELASAAHRYTSNLDTLDRSPELSEASADQRRYRGEFMEAARRELDIQEPPLYQRGAPHVTGRVPQGSPLQPS